MKRNELRIPSGTNLRIYEYVSKWSKIVPAINPTTPMFPISPM